MNETLARWSSLEPIAAAREILPCCGSQAWAAEMAARRPIADEAALYLVSDAVWLGLSESAWQEAFESHPRIGQRARRRPDRLRGPGPSRARRCLAML